MLAGSAAYAVGDAFNWRTGLDNMPWQATGFYAVIGMAMLLGLGTLWSPLDPIKALYWSAVVNGVQSALRAPDGIHFSVVGENVLATFVAHEISAIYHVPITLHEPMLIDR